MKIKALEYFIAVAEFKSINEAARQLYIAQPSLTKSMHLLEEEIGGSLFQRTNTGVQLTPLGQKILPEAKEVVAYYRNWKELAQENTLKEIEIYSFISFPDFLLPDILLRFRKKHPDLNVHLRVSGTPQNYISKSEQKPVIVLTTCDSEAEVEQLSQKQGNPPTVLMNGGYRCLINAQNPLAQKESIDIGELKKYYLAVPEMGALEKGKSFLREFFQGLESENTSPKVIYVDSVSNVLSLVEQDPEVYALSYYPALMRYRGVAWQKLVWLPIRNKHTERPMTLFYSRQACYHHPVLQELIDIICVEARRFLDEVSNE